MTSVNNDLIKNCFNLYGDQSLYNNYCKIANKYYKIYNKECKDKKYSSDNQEKLRDDVKKWLFSQSLENRMKICTVENEFFGKIIYQMYLKNKIDRTIMFKPKPNFYTNEEIQFEKNIDNLELKNEEKNIYPHNNNNNTNVKVTRTNKSGKKIEAKIVGFSQADLNDFKDEEIGGINYGNYFVFYSQRKGNLSLSEMDNHSNGIQDKKIIEISTDDFFNNIIFFSVHHRYFPDCFTLSPEFLLEKSKFENIFNKLGNNKYFCSLIQSQIIPNNNKNQKQYMLPDWFKINNEGFYSVAQYAIAFFEQVIMIKYLFNKNDKKIKTYSLIDEQPLNRFFSDRKLAINYMKNNYNNENKINILKELEIDDNYKELINNKEKMKYVEYFKNLIQKVNNEKFKNNPHIVDSILNNPYHNKFEEKYNKKNGIEKSKNINKNTYNNKELTLDEIANKLNELLKNNDSICFVDYLLFQNCNCIWKIEYFLQSLLFEKLSNLIMEQNCKELISDSKQSKSNKSKHRRKNKKNKGVSSVPKEKEKEKPINNNNNVVQNEYDGIFKDEEEELYAPYYLRADTEQKKLFLKLKGNSINNNIGITEKEIIKDYIYNEFILGIIIDNVFLTPLNSGLDFSKELKEDYFNFNIKNYKKKINEITQTDENEIKEEKEKEDKYTIINNDNDKKDELNNNIIKEEEMNNQNNSNEINLDTPKSNKIELIDNNNNNNSKDNDLDINDSLSLKSDTISSEIDKISITTITTNTNTIENNTNNKDINGMDLNKKNDNINNSNNSSSTKQKKKKEKEQTFFLFDTVKKKKKKNTQNSNINSLISNEFNIITLKESNRRLQFYDKLHNDIIRYETKVITLLNQGMIFKDYCVKEIKRIIQETFNSSNEYNIDVYGSYATGLMIEASDIDINIKLNHMSKDNLDNCFQTLCQRLEDENRFDAINPIGTASVPVIKLLLNSEKFIKGKEDLESNFKQYKELPLFKHYLFDISELTTIKIDVTFIMKNASGTSKKNNIEIKENNSENNNNINNNNNDNITNKTIKDNETVHDHDKSLGGEMSSVAYVKEQIIKYPEIKFILRVLKRYFYYRKMNKPFLGGLSSYNLFLLILSYAKYFRIQQNLDLNIIDNANKNKNKNKKVDVNLGIFLFNFLYFFKCSNFKQCVIDINSPNIYSYDLITQEKAQEYNYGKSIVIIDPLTGVNASKSSYKIDEIHNILSKAFDFFHNEKLNYDKEGNTKVSKNNNSNKDILMGLPTSNKNDNNHGGGNIIEKFFMFDPDKL